MSDGGGNIYRFNRKPVRDVPIIEPFQPFYASQMEGRQPRPREWLIDGVLLRGTVVLLAGPPKIGKTLLGQQMLTAIALGAEWLGRPCRRARAFGLWCEDAQDEIERRQMAINAYYDRSPADLELDLSWEAREARETLLVDFDRTSEKPKFTPLWHQLWTHVEETGVEVVLIDTAAATFGGNENYRNQVTAFMRALVRRAVMMNGCVVLNVHPSKGTPHGYSGTTGWLASSRFAMSLGRPPDYDPETDTPSDVRVLRSLGANFPGGLTIERLRFANGVLAREDQPEAKRRKPLTMGERQELEYRMLIGLRRVRENGGKVPADEFAALSMPNRAKKSDDPQLNRIALNDLYAAQRSLIASGMVVRVEVGRQVLLRPADGKPYPDEKPWVSA